MIILTGAAGFIGSCILAKLNERGYNDIIIVDHFEGEGDEKKLNLQGKRYARFYDKSEFIDLIQKNKLEGEVSCVIHMGACSSTTLQDEAYYLKNNFEFSRILAQWSLAHQARFIYASSAATYGDGAHGYKDDEAIIRRCKPLNFYGESKQKFDLWILDQLLANKVVGLKFFNVFGPNEYHKGDMRSVVAKAYERAAQEGKIVLFKSHVPEYADGEQRRDFIYVKDVVGVVMYFFDNPQINGIYNVGSGQARSWNDLAKALFKAIGRKPSIEYVEMPAILKARYQNFTEADIAKLRNSGYRKPFTSLEDAVSDYVSYLKDKRYL